MNELQLVGYTADLKFLVFSDVVDGARFKVPVDDDLVATLGEVLQLIDPDREPFVPGAGEPQPPQWREEPPPPPPPPAPTPEPAAERRNGRRLAPKPGEGPLAAFAALADPIPAVRANGVAADPEGRSSKLSPRQIQALLRSGLTTRQVARRAEIDEGWVRRWLPPIEAERRLVLQAVEQARVTKARLGESRDLLGEAVRKNLAEKGLRPDDESVEWAAAKREGDPHWVVTLQYRSRGRKQRAIWHFNPDSGDLDPRNSLAVDVAWTRPRKSGRRAGAGASAPTRKAMADRRGAARPAKKSAAKKPAAKKPAAKKPAAKKPAAKKPAAKKPAAKKPAAKKPAAKKPAARKPAAKKPAAKKSAAKKPAATTARKAPARKPAARKR